MRKSRLIASGLTAATLVIAVLILFLPEQPSQGGSPLATKAAASVDLGVTYLPVNKDVAIYYNLEVSSGALITEVTRDSLAAGAGVRKGDVILSYNGNKLGEGTSLLGLMRKCPVGSTIALEVLRGAETMKFKFLHRGE